MAVEIESVNEESSGYLTVTFLDKDGNPAAPSSATYRIDCRTNEQEVKGDTALSPATSVEIHLTPTDNEIISQENEAELRTVTVEASYGVNGGVKDRYLYRVMNLAFVT